MKISVILEALTGSFETDIKRASKTISKSAKQIETDYKAMGQTIGIALAGAATAISVGVNRTIKEMDKINDVRKMLNVTATALTGLKFAAEQSGTSFDTLSGGLKKLSVNMALAAGGDKKMSELFSAMGVSVEDATGKIRSADAVFLDMAERFKNYEDGAGEVAIAAKVFGKSAGPELVQFLNTGQKGISDLIEEAKELGVVFDNDAAEGAAKLQDNMDKLKSAMDGVWLKITDQLLPTMTALSDIMVQSSKDANAGSDDWRGFGMIADDVAKSVLILKNSMEAFLLIPFAAFDTITGGLRAVGDYMLSLNKTVATAIVSGPVAAQKVWAEESVKLSANQAQIATEIGAAWSAVGSGVRNELADMKAASEAFSPDTGNAFDGVFNGVEKGTEAVFGFIDSLDKAQPPVEALAGGLDVAAEAATKAREHIVELESELREGLLDAAAEGADAMEAIADMSAKLAGPAAVGLREYNKKIAEFDKLLDAGGISAVEHGRALEVLRQQRMLDNEEIEKSIRIAEDKRQQDEQALDVVGNTIKEIEEELRVMQLSGKQLFIDTALREANAKASELRAAGVDRSATLTATETAELVKNAAAQYDRGIAIDAAIQAQDRMNQAFERSFDDLTSAFGDFLSGGMDGFGDFADSIIKSNQGLIADLAKQWASTAFGPNGSISGANNNLAQSLNQNSMYGAGGKGGSVGGWAGAIGSAYGAWQNAAQGGSKLKTVAGFTAAGAQIGGIYGAAVGLVVGILVAAFKKVKPPDIRAGGANAQVRKVEESFQTDFGTVQIGTRGGIKISEIAKAMQTFDENLFKMVDSFEGADERIQAIKQALSTWAVDLTGNAATAENLLQQRFDVIVGTFEDAVADYVHGGKDLEEQVQRLGDALSAEAAFMNAELEISFGEFLQVIDTMGSAGESASETMNRVIGSVKLLDAALDTTGVNLDLTGEEFVRFASEISAAAGGLDAAAALWENYFNAFYSAQELGAIGLAGLQSGSGDALAGLGLAPDTTMQQFRDLFDEALPELSATAIVEWLRAADALASLTAAENQLSIAREEYANWLEDLGQVTEFGQDVRDITRSIADMTAQANTYAQASGRAGASTEELAQITNWASRQFAMAVDRLKERVADLVSQLYGSQIDQLDAMIEASESARSGAQSAVDEINRANQQRYEQELQYIEQIQDFVKSLMLSAQSPLNPNQRFNEARSQFQTDLAAAQGGDINALSRLQGGAQTYLTEAQSYLGPSDQYTQLFNDIVGQLSGLGVSGTPEQPTTTTILMPSAELDALYARREALLLDQEERNRQSLSESLAVQLGELSAATRESTIALAEEMGISLETLIADLGVSLDSLTVQTTQELADVARTLNLSISDLAESVGLSLGELTETNSLLNDAFEQELAALPEDIQDQLKPLLEAVENAVDDADANTSIALLRDAVDALAPGLRDELAPYLGLDPSFADPIVDLATVVDFYGQQQVASLQNIETILYEIAESNTIGDTVIPVQAGANANNTLAGLATGDTPQTATADNANYRIESLLQQIISEVKNGASVQANAVSLAVAKSANNRGY